ncbi:DUF3168 domain-containing protein [Methylobacterium nonmethylotrophicum]|uniref:DUF3168 domain-containing protein n=1 Tax=Methylobacterium nonmethylotrophicum TaxID=1141884 RepID=A0A4Z0NK81_9HYPH|nr:DUF3168 domain-containing protein [Methylobacterium nonmethylotrophicum]TGD96474.1 DUF3168 domain-containing protein [Methylobacterium nonmethylotrophicum]
MAGLDLSPDVLRAVRARLLADPPLRALVGGRVREAVSAREEWPFLRVDPPEVSPYEAQRWRGCACRLTVHAFLRGARGLGPVQALLAAVAQALDEADLTLDRGELLWIAHERSLVLPEPLGPGSWHGVARFAAVAAETT